MKRLVGHENKAEVNVWRSMWARCSSPSAVGYADYGGRGIKVCRRWYDFDKFLKDMGHRPTRAHSIDRIENDGDYAPGNCRWATRRQQSRNRRSNVMMTYKGKTLCLHDWVRLKKISKTTMMRRIKDGWPVDKLLAPKPERQRYAEQVRKKYDRTKKILKVGPRSQSMSEWARESGIYRSQIAWRLKRGFPLEIAVKPASEVDAWLSAGAPGRQRPSQKGGRMSGLYRLLTFRGRTQGLEAWAAEVGIHHSTLRRRLASGMAVEKALTLPANKRNRW